MLKRLHLRNFTVFEDADFEFGPGLNVLVGANGTGKSHVLKAGYAVEKAWKEIKNGESTGFETAFIEAYAKETNTIWGIKLVGHLSEIFLIDNLKALVRNQSLQNATVRVTFTSKVSQVGFTGFGIDRETGSLSIDGTGEVTIDDIVSAPVFIPAKEVLTLGWLRSLYDLRQIPIDQTYPDLLRLLSIPPLKLPPPESLSAQVQLMSIIGGTVEEEGGRYYLISRMQPRMEMNLVAEGVRKFATLYKLLANGTLTPETTLFWDEPEANLNPALLREMAAVLTELAKAGFQIILATHSLFLLKELHILARQENKPVRYFGLSAQPGEATTVATADNLELLPDIVALDAELDQADRFQRVLDQEDADGN